MESDNESEDEFEDELESDMSSEMESELEGGSKSQDKSEAANASEPDLEPAFPYVRVRSLRHWGHSCNALQRVGKLVLPASDML